MRDLVKGENRVPAQRNRGSRSLRKTYLDPRSLTEGKSGAADACQSPMSRRSSWRRDTGCSTRYVEAAEFETLQPLTGAESAAVVALGGRRESSAPSRFSTALDGTCPEGRVSLLVCSLSLGEPSGAFPARMPTLHGAACRA